MNFKPSIQIITKETQREYYNNYRKSPYKNIYYPTYRELKKNLKLHLEHNHESTVTVIRKRMGEWGEWFEKWELNDGRPRIVKQGWM